MDYPDWLQQLTAGHTTGRILPGGMLWEDPPATLHTARPKGIPRTVNVYSKVLEPVGGSPLPPVPVRLRVLQVLHRNPGRWARVYDGDWSSTRTVMNWFRWTWSIGWCDAVSRRQGLTVAVYVRYFNSEMGTR